MDEESHRDRQRKRSKYGRCLHRIPTGVATRPHQHRASRRQARTEALIRRLSDAKFAIIDPPTIHEHTVFDPPIGSLQTNASPLSSKAGTMLAMAVWVFAAPAYALTAAPMCARRNAGLLCRRLIPMETTPLLSEDYGSAHQRDSPDTEASNRAHECPD